MTSYVDVQYSSWQESRWGPRRRGSSAVGPGPALQSNGHDARQCRQCRQATGPPGRRRRPRPPSQDDLHAASCPASLSLAVTHRDRGTPGTVTRLRLAPARPAGTGSGLALAGWPPPPHSGGQPECHCGAPPGPNTPSLARWPPSPHWHRAVTLERAQVTGTSHVTRPGPAGGTVTQAHCQWQPEARRGLRAGKSAGESRSPRRCNGTGNLGPASHRVRRWRRSTGPG
jgi:hypothetical protein